MRFALLPQFLYGHGCLAAKFCIGLKILRFKVYLCMKGEMKSLVLAIIVMLVPLVGCDCGNQTAGAGQTATIGPTATVDKTTIAGLPALVSSNWKSYRNEKYEFELKYPREGRLVEAEEEYARIDLPFAPETNLEEKYIEIVVNESLRQCSSPLSKGYEPGAIHSELVLVNGLEFRKESGSEGAAGSFYHWVSYSTAKENLCISLSLVLHSLNPGNFATPLPVFDEQEEIEIFQAIVSTFI